MPSLSQVGRTLLYLGNYDAAAHVFEDAVQLAPKDWELWHNQGACYMAAKHYDRSALLHRTSMATLCTFRNTACSSFTGCRAVASFVQAKSIEQHDSTFLQLGKVYALQANYPAAIQVCLEALQLCPDNAEVLTTIGLLYLRMGENLKAFDFLGNALSNDPRNVKSILAAASVIQASRSLQQCLLIGPRPYVKHRTAYSV